MAFSQYIYLAFFMVMALISLPAQAESSQIGTVIEVEGIAIIARSGKKMNLIVDAPVYLNDQIATGAESRAHILLIDDTEITLGEHSNFIIDDYVFDESYTDENKGRFSALRGSFLFVSGLLSKKSEPDVQIKTAVGSIGIRGTTVWGGPNSDEYEVLVQDGEVDFVTEAGSSRIRAGEGSRVRGKKFKPSAARRFQQTEIDRATRTVTLKRKAQVRQRVQEKKKNHVELRRKHRENLKVRRDQRRDNRQERRQEKQENRQDKREQKQDLRQEKKSDRQEQQQDKKQQRKDNRPQRKQNRPDRARPGR